MPARDSSRRDFKGLVGPGASCGSLGISGGSCGTGGRDGGRATVVAECRVVPELMLVREPKSGDEAAETRAVLAFLEAAGLMEFSPQGTDWRYTVTHGQAVHCTSSGPGPEHFQE